MIVKVNYINYSILIIFVLISFLFIQYGDEIWGGVIALGILILLSLIISRMDLIHPLTWFSPIYFLYSASVPILVATGDLPYRNGLKETLFLEWVGLLTFITVIGFLKRSNNKISDIEKLKNLDVVLFPVYIIALILTTIYLVYIFFNGLDSKYSIALDQSGIGMLKPFFSVYTLTFILLIGYSLAIKKKYPLNLILFNIAYSFIALLIIGERDLLLKVILGVLFLTHVLFKRISRRKIIFMGMLIILIIPILGDLKSAAFEKVSSTDMNQSLLYKILGSEFIAASRNLNVLLNESNSWSYFLGKTFWWDIQVAFFNGSNSVIKWFNETYYPNLTARGGGNGFTIVGEGYVNFGLFGVILIFGFLGLFVKFLYLKANKSILWLTIYITCIPIFVYLNRADLATLFAQVSKHIILPIIIIFILKSIVEKVAGQKGGSNTLIKNKELSGR